MYYSEVCEKYKLEKTEKGEHLILNNVSSDKLSSLVNDLKQRIRKLDTLINQLLDKTFDGTKAQIRAQELSRKKNLTDLSDEEYYSKLILTDIQAELAKRKRNNVVVSAKALNNGGVYTTGTLSQPRVGMGFKGYGGVCL